MRDKGTAMNRTMLAAVLSAMAALAGGSALAESNNSDKTFAPIAVQSGMAEIQDAQVAERKTSNPEILRFAQQMIKDHATANKDLNNILANKKDLYQPSHANQGQQSERANLKDENGKAFEKSYVQQEIQAHQDAIKAFEHEAESGADLDVRAFATKHLPMLQEHLQMAQAIKIPD
jgi:putative membrane protein